MDIAAVATACSSTASSSTAAARAAVQDDHPGRPRRTSPRSPQRQRGGRRPRRRRRPPRVRHASGRGCPAPTAASTCSASPGSCRSAPASSPSPESLDNGKPIKESRDVDVPLAAAHFFYHAGWADKLDYAGLGADPRPLGVAGQVIPWNFPLLMLAWKIAPGAGRRQHRRPQAGRDHAADRAALRRDLPAGRPAARRRQHPHRRRRDRRARWSSHAGRRQGRVHRLDRGRQGDRPHDRRHPQEARRSSSAARPPTSSSTTPPIDQAVEGIVNGIFFNQGHVCCAGSRLLVQETVAEEVVERLKRRLHDAARRRPAGQEHRRRRDQLAPRSWTGSAS